MHPTCYMIINLDGFVKSSNSRRVNFVIMRRTFRTLNDYEMQHNAEVGLFTKPSILFHFHRIWRCARTAFHCDPCNLVSFPFDTQK